MKFDKRAIHRDLGYFYVGLIISFAVSGIMMNHRNQWHPEKYVIEKSPFKRAFLFVEIGESYLRIRINFLDSINNY